MSEAVSTHPSKAGRRWLTITLRVLVGVLMVIAALQFLVNIAGIVGVWSVYGPAKSGVADVAATMTHTLGMVDNGLGRLNNGVLDARHILTQVNTEATALGNRVKANSPVATRLRQLVESKLAPRVDNARTTASGIRDAVVSVSSALALLNRIPGVTVPPLSPELGTVSDQAQAALAAVQDLRVTLAGIQAGLVTQAETAVKQVTARIDAPLARIQVLVNKYQVVVAHTQARILTISSTILTLMTTLAVVLTIHFLLLEAALALLIYFCWKYVRNGRFPSLRISITP